MIRFTLWQRLHTALLILILLLLIGVGLAFWVEEIRSLSVQRRDQLAAAVIQLYLDTTQMSDATRGVLLNPDNDLDRRRRADAERNFLNTIQGLQIAYSHHLELVNSLQRLRDFGLKTLAAYDADLLRRVETNRTAATQHYLKTFPELRQQRDQLLNEFKRQKDLVATAELEKAQTAAMIGMVGIVVIALVSVVVGRFQSAAVTGPLNQLVEALERMRRGDFRVRLGLKRKDEFGVLAEGLDRLAEDLSGLVGQVQKSGIQVNTTATEIAATAREQQSTANEIAATTAEIGATSKEISATSKELVKTMNEVSAVAEETANLANSGQSAIARMEATMRQIMEASGSVSAKLAVLSEKTANINSVVTTITKVADQTNLLSLNAAIEAEKAGEYGLGFAVVAMEIRRLADQTAVATYDIEKMVKEMQTAVAAGVMGMDKFSEDVRRGVEEIRLVSTQLAQIIHQVQTLTPRFQTVNEGMHAQATGAEQISETLVQLSEAAQQTAESLRQSNLAIEQLNEAARGLQASVARFKLESG